MMNVLNMVENYILAYIVPDRFKNIEIFSLLHSPYSLLFNSMLYTFTHNFINSLRRDTVMTVIID